MNLLTDPCWPVRRRDGATGWLTLPQIADPANPPVAFAWPRPDLRNASMELCIGLLTLALQPRSERDWLRLNDTPPHVDELAKKLAPYVAAFEIDGDGRRFMQESKPDFEVVNPKENSRVPISALLFDSPGASTVKNNRDWFIKAAPDAVLCRAAAALVLYAAQSYTPGVGRGNRQGFRRGGPITTIVLPNDQPTLFEIAVANLPIGFEFAAGDLPQVLPWMTDTHRSRGADAKRRADPPLKPEQVRRLQAFFGMPSPIRLIFEPGKGRRCMITDGHDDMVVAVYRRTNYGMMYSGISLEHPLTPYDLPSDQSIKQGKTTSRSVATDAFGVGWYDVMGYVLRAKDGRRKPAQVVQTFRTLATDARRARLRASGYAFENAKVLGYVEADLPLPMFATEAARIEFDGRVGRVIQSAVEVRDMLRQTIWLCLEPRVAGRSKTKMLTAQKRAVMVGIDRRFWDSTRQPFQDLLGGLAAAAAKGDVPPNDWNTTWLAALRRTAFGLFDETTYPDPARPAIAPGGAGEWVVVATEQRRKLAFLLSGYGPFGGPLFAKLELPLPVSKQSPPTPERSKPDA